MRRYQNPSDDIHVSTGHSFADTTYTAPARAMTFRGSPVVPIELANPGALGGFPNRQPSNIDLNDIGVLERQSIDVFRRATRYATVATCSLDQLAMDFDGNLKRIIESIRVAKEKGARLRLGPELEICGYGCEDHFFEIDTVLHCWESLAMLLQTDATDNLLCDFGMPVIHQDVRYNCRVICLDRKVLLIRPKICLADEGNYREGRWFTGWARGYVLESFYLPGVIQEITGQAKCPFGAGCIALHDTAYAPESCEELFTVNNPSIALGLGGVEIIGNGSGSHHTLRKRTRRLELIEETTRKNGGVYLYSNQMGCDGGRLYFDGSSMVCVNGNTVALGSQFSIRDVEVVVATVSLNDVRSLRSGIASRGIQAASSVKIPHVEALHFSLCINRDELVTPPQTMLSAPRSVSEEEELARGTACWLWGYLRKSGLPGFFLPLSGGLDSAATAAIVGIMCDMVYQEGFSQGHQQTIEELRKVVRDRTFSPKSGKDICKKLFYTCYMGTSYSSDDTFQRAQSLANELGCNFRRMNIDGVVNSMLEAYEQIAPRPNIARANSQENIAAQNVQARSRMVLSYLCAQMMLASEHPDQAWPGTLLVLGSANLDEALRGYYTKYDCSSADLNPIGSCTKNLLRRFLVYASEKYNWPTLAVIRNAQPSAELQPIGADGKQAQVSEDEMGMTFGELETFGKLRLNERCGPVSMYHRLRVMWRDQLGPKAIAEKVKKFFRYYAINRHKVTTLPPAAHVESHSCDDNRYDLRQFLYAVNWPRQFRGVDAAAERDEGPRSGARTPSP